MGLYYNCFSSTDCTFHDVTDYLFIPYFIPIVCTVPVNEINGENSSRQELMYIDLRKRPRGKEHLKVKNGYIMEEVSRAGLSILNRPA